MYKLILENNSFYISDNNIVLYNKIENKLNNINLNEINDISNYLIILKIDESIKKINIKDLTPYDGTLTEGHYKNVVDIKIGDKLIGKNNTTRTVLELHTGKELLYKFTTENNKVFEVNEGHILHLINIKSNEEIDLAVKDLLSLNKDDFKLIDRNDNCLVSFDYEATNIDDYFGFTVDGDNLYQDSSGIVHHNSGKSVCLNNIMAHISKFPDKIQAVGIDLKQVEFTQFRGLRGFKSVAWDINSASELTTAFRRIMDKRFAMMRENKTNNIFKIKNLEVDYYTLGGVDYQFDEIFEVIRDLDPESREYRKLKVAYPDGRQATIMTIEELYEGIKSGAIKNPQIPERKGVNSWLDEYSIRKTKGEFKPKLSIMMVDELNELMTNGDYHAVDTIKGNLNSLCRLGRAAGVHSVFAMQNANGSAMSGDMRANISSSIIFGDFDGTASTNLFERDYSNMSRPEIKGRGIMNSGKDIIEFQGYYASEEDSWYFDETLKWTYENPIYDKQCEKRGIIPDPTGFIEQIKPGDKVEIDIETIRRSKQKIVEEQKLEEPNVDVSHKEPKKLKLNIKK